MKLKTTLILFFALAISASSFSQFSAGLETGQSVPNIHTIGAFGLGGSIRCEAPIKNKLSWTSGMGYLSFAGISQNEVSTRIKMIPISGGIKYYFSEPRKGLYAATDLGLNFIIATTAYSLSSYPVKTFDKPYLLWGFSPGIGYRTNRWDFTGRYNCAWDFVIGAYNPIAGVNAAYISLRAAYVFGKK